MYRLKIITCSGAEWQFPWDLNANHLEMLYEAWETKGTFSYEGSAKEVMVDLSRALAIHIADLPHK